MTEKVEHRVGVQAPASVIWEIISDVAAWPQWSGIYPRAAGKIGFHEKLSLTLALPGAKPRELTPVVFDWAPDEAIHWRTRYFRGFAWSVRFLEIEAMHDHGCVFNNGEIYGGLLEPEAFRPIKSALKAGYAAFGEALKERAERLWRERSGGAT
jgi:hypothetical protein